MFTTADHHITAYVLELHCSILLNSFSSSSFFFFFFTNHIRILSSVDNQTFQYEPLVSLHTQGDFRHQLSRHPRLQATSLFIISTSFYNLKYSYKNDKIYSRCIDFEAQLVKMGMIFFKCYKKKLKIHFRYEEFNRNQIKTMYLIVLQIFSLKLIC